MSVWKRIDSPDAGFIYSLSDSLSILSWRRPDCLDSVSNGKMVLASDYSGQHKGATHEAYSFVITTDNDLAKWLPLRNAFRNQWLPDGRRLSFKKLNKTRLNRALLPFLETAGKLRGNVITVLVDCNVPTFIDGGAQAIASTLPDCFSLNTPAGSIEKMFRLASLLAMITAGLRREEQSSIWISDQDETLATFERREQIARLSTYLTIGLTGWRNPADSEFLTTEHPHLPYWAEDLLSMPDIFAGSFCRLGAVIPPFGGSESWTQIRTSTAEPDERARIVGNWLSMTRSALRHVLLRLEIDETGIPRTSAQYFAGALQ